MMTLTDNRLTEIGQAYLAFLGRAGKANCDFTRDIPKLFSPDCKKLVNGKTLSEKSSAFGEYLLKAREVHGQWRVNQNYHITPSLSTRSVTINYTVESDHIKLLVMAILKINSDHLISEIEEVDHALNPDEPLLQATRKYLEFVNQISQGDTFPQMEKAATILAPDCIKFLNGQTYTKTREAFVSDLLTVYQTQGGWKLTPLETIPVPSINAVILRLNVEMRNSDKYTEMVILRFNSRYMITEMNEVLSKVTGTYDF